ncbi:MAG TPA: hypothetical protein PLZ57_02990 [Pseudobdellovibrionaceae bacterium]|nr:hypothetical protein [Pseudobdellovibrionaceae bacterium]
MNSMSRGESSWGKFGAMLALIIAVTPLWWLHTGAREFLVSGVPELCWPGFENCGAWRFASQSRVDLVFIALGVGGLCSALALWFKPQHRMASASLALMFAVKLLLSALDYRLRGNHHQMANLVTLIFLLVPRPAATFALLIPSFYFAAGLLKLNAEWLSGAALADRLPLRGWLLELSLIGIVLMELIGIWWLLDRQRSPWRFWSILGILFVFHLVSIESVGFFYPIVMAALLSCFLWTKLDWPIFWASSSHAQPVLKRFSLLNLAKSWRASGGEVKLAWIVSGVFVGVQFLPALISARNDLSGEGRLIASSMVHNRTECRGFMRAQWGVHEAQIPMPVMQLPIRIWCDPLVFYNHARQMCREQNPDRLDWYLLSRNTSEAEYQLIVQARDFCRDPRRYPWLGKLPWGGQ